MAQQEYPNGSGAHLLDCKSSFAAMEYDPRCSRCSKIQKVIALRRKNSRTGASLQESTSAAHMADKLVALYRLTRGEVYDREYESFIVANRQEQSRTQAKTHRKRNYVLCEEDME